MRVQYTELKQKYDDVKLENERLQNRFDSLEFYAKTKSNSGAFHNLPSPTTSSLGVGSSSSSMVSRGSTLSNRDRGRSPTPSLSSTSASVIGLPPSGTRSRRSSITRASVERQLPSSLSSSSYTPSSAALASSISMLKMPANSISSSSYSTSSDRRYDRYGTLPSYSTLPPPSPTSYRSPYSSSSSYYTGTNSRYNRYHNNHHDSDDDYYSTSNNNTSNVLMRRRERSIDRTSISPTSRTLNTLTRLRRSSFADTSKYYQV